MEWSEVVNQLIQILLPILATFLTGVFTYIANRLKKVYEEKANTETAKTVAQDAVKFVEQVYKDLHGKEKLEKATQQVSEILQSKGINISDAEINMLIESAVYGLNEGWFSDTTKQIEESKQHRIKKIMKCFYIKSLWGHIKHPNHFIIITYF